jgi:hypothetical protein
MTSSTSQRAGRMPLCLTAMLAACLAPLLAACAGAAAQVHLPAKAAATRSAAPAAPPAQTPRQQVVAAFTGYTAAMAAAFDSRSPAQVRQLLRPYLDRATISNAIQAFSRAWGQNEISYGHAVQHIIGVKVRGGTAWVHDCDDTSKSGLAYAGTGQVVPGTLGSPDANLVTRLDLVGGHWHVGVQTVEDVPCTP